MGRKKAYSYDPNNKARGKGRRRGNISTDVDATELTGSVTWYAAPSIDPGFDLVIIDGESMGRTTAGNSTPQYIALPTSSDELVNIVNRIPGINANASNIAEAYAALASSDKCFVAPSKTDNIPVDGLVLEYDARNLLSYPGTGNTMYDLSGNGNDATIYNSPSITTGSTGHITFDGSNDYLQVTRDSSMDGWNTEQTVTMWISHSYTSGRRNPWNQAYGGYGTWTHEQGNYLNQYFGDAGSNTSPYLGQSNSANPPARGQWNFIATTRNTSQHKWYTNGDLVSTRNHSYGTLTTDNNSVLIGRGYAGYWIGKMGKIAAYDKALSADEIKQLYYGAPIKTSNLILALDAGILGSYGGQGNVWMDLTGNYDFTLVNSPDFITHKGIPCFKFDASNDYATRAGSISHDIGSSCTLTIVMSSIGNTNFGSCSRLFSVNDGGSSNNDYTTYFTLASCNQSKYGMWYKNNPGGLYPSSNLKTETDDFMIVTYKWTAGSNLSIFVNGAKESSSSVTSAFNYANVGRMTIGMNSSLTQENAYIQVAAVYMYNEELSDAEVLENFEALRPKFGL